MIFGSSNETRRRNLSDLGSGRLSNPSVDRENVSRGRGQAPPESKERDPSGPKRRLPHASVVDPSWRRRSRIPRGIASVTHSIFECQGLDKRGGGTVSTFDAAVHVAKKVNARMLARELQPAAKSGFRPHLQQGGLYCPGLAPA